ncbi:MAG: chromosomal replication initiator protein DnaA [Peptoniphilaceae bacterium]|nr:chromosomal replication initiator protein DnaA [Peptoniphilaceae bacterium]MDY6085308.1 chromosomal replication initiator protein DnaA [Peptoniphilaceae bacterium]
MNELMMIWNEVINMLELELNPIQLKNWIQPLIPLALDRDTLYLDSTSGFIHSMVDKKYKDDIARCISYICDRPISIVLVDPSMAEYEATLERFRDGVAPVEPREGGDDPEAVAPLFMPEKRAVHPAQDEAVQKHWEEKKFIEQQRRTNGYATLNPKYTIDSFVRGASNDFAYATARAVIREPGMVYNPLFIYGLSGLGKTHLMQAIAHEILKDPTKKVLYITSENFMNEMIAVIENGTNAEKENFRRKYRSIDCLLIDDIQFIAGKKATMEEVFHTFNDLKEAGRQIVLSADKPPKELKNLEDRLVTRFEGGMTVDIQQPDFETRVAILNHKMKGESLSLPQYVIEFIATHVTSNIRELEGALLRVLAYFRFKEGDGTTMDRDEALQTTREALKMEEHSEAELSTDEIIRRVADFYSLKADDLTSKSRQGAIVLPRQVAMYLCRELTNASLMHIGRAFDRDHTTVMHAVDKIRDRMRVDETIKSDIEALTAQLTHV